MNTIETERLILREPVIADAEPLLEIQNSPFVQKYNAMKIIDIEKMREKISGYIENRDTMFIICKEDNKLIGAIWFSDDESRHDVKCLFLSYYLSEQYARKGYMKEALRALIEALFTNDSELVLLSSGVFSENVGSERLLCSLGFVHEGTIRRAVRDNNGVVHDDKRFSLLREEWE